jgi:hypothetical protein
MAMTAIFAAMLSWWRMWREHFLPKKGVQRQLLQSSQGDGLRRNKFWCVDDHGSRCHAYRRRHAPFATQHDRIIDASSSSSSFFFA